MTKQTRQIDHRDLEPGMRVWNTGHLFEVKAVFSYMDNGKEVVRYVGKCPKLIGTGYDGATYGAYGNEPCEIEPYQIRLKKKLRLKNPSIYETRVQGYYMIQYYNGDLAVGIECGLGVEGYYRELTFNLG